MSPYFIGIDISKNKHNFCIINVADQRIIAKLTIENDKDGFKELLSFIQSLSTKESGLNLQSFMPSFLDSSPRTTTIALWES